MNRRVGELVHELKKALVFIYIAEIPMIPWFTYMIAKNWNVSLYEVILVSILTFAYALLHVWAIIEYEETWG
jgi:hypothetical protein